MSLGMINTTDDRRGIGYHWEIRVRFFFTLATLVATSVLELAAAEMRTVNGNSYSIDAPAEWIDQSATPELLPSKSDGPQYAVSYLLLDSQHHLEDEVRYSRYVRQFNNEEGVQSESQVRLTFDPSYQNLVVHHVRLVRGAEDLDQLDSARVEIIQQEPELTAHIYNGRVTVVFFLNDVRVGDRLDYAFTVKGANPVLGGRAVGEEYLQWSAPIAYQSLRVLVPDGRDVQLQSHGTVPPPTTRPVPGGLEHLWQERDAKPLDIDSDLPGWFDPYGYVEWSEFPTWGAVAKWALGLYPKLGQTAAVPAMQVNEWKQNTDPMERARLALRFVQDEVRYLGFELGPQSYQPAAPATVLERRFGDCKDKSYLLCSLLRAMDIEASPALVTTVRRGTVADGLPSPYAFNHVICQVSLNGQTLWLDPTRSQQRGPVNQLYVPDYGMALVLKPGTDGLTPMKPSLFGQPSTKVIENFVIRDYDGNAKLTVQTEYTGSEADRQRGWHADTTGEDLQKEFLNYYARTFPNISVDEPVKIVDDTVANRLRVTEKYVINDIWQDVDTGRRLIVEFNAWSISELLGKPGTVLRTMPFRTPHPIDRTHEIWVRLPDEWNIDPDDETVTSPAFDFSFKSASVGNSIHLTYKFRSKADHLQPDQTARYVKALETVNDNLWYYVQHANPKTDAPGAMNWIVLFAACMWGLMMLVAAFFVYRIRPDHKVPPPIADPKLAGLGGWLILVAFGLFVSPFAVGFTIWQTLIVFEPVTWAALTTAGGESYHVWWAPVLILELTGKITLIVFCVLLLVLFFQKRRTFPAVYIVFEIFAVTLLVLYEVAARALPVELEEADKSFAALGRDIFWMFVWVAYMLQSKRVKATFVN